MKVSKVLLFVAFSMLISSFAIANPTSGLEPTESTKTVTTKIKSIIEKLDIDPQKLESKTVKIKFLVTESDQLVVLSTEDSNLDRTLKNALNYTTVDAENVKYNKIYILPVTFE